MDKSKGFGVLSYMKFTDRANGFARKRSYLLADQGRTTSLVGEYPVPIILSKLTLEPPRAFLPRKRLADLVGEGSRPKLVLVHAPAGSGKSTALYQLVSTSPSAGVYYRLSTADRDIPQFVSYLTAGICRHDSSFGHKVKAYLNEIYERPVLARAVRDIFIHEISRISGWNLTFILDDYQDVDDSPEIAALVKDLVDALPLGVRLIIASRGVPALPLSRWRVHGDLLEVGSTDLAFSKEETKELFYRIAGLHLGSDQLSAIYTATEGWPAGLALAAQIARTHPAEETVRLVQGFVVTNSPIYDYLAEQVYATQPPQLKRFLRRSSILGYLSPGLCNELMGIEDAGSILDDLYRAGLFLLPIEMDARTFRYHQLFRKFLRSKFEEEETRESIQRLRRVAGQALEARQQWDEAVRHYALGGDLKSAIALIERFGEQAIESGQLERVSRVLRYLPQEVVEGQPRLLALRGLMALRMGDTPTALRIFEQCGVSPGGESNHPVDLAVAKHVGLAHYREGRYSDAARLLGEAIEQGNPDIYTRIGLMRLLGVAHRGAGQLDKAEQCGQEALRLLKSYPKGISHPEVTRVAIIRNIARVALCRGELNNAVQLSREAVRISEAESAGEFQQVRALTILGAALAARGDLDESIQTMEAAREKGGNFYPPEKQWIEGWSANVYRDMGKLELAEQYYNQSNHRYSYEHAFLLLRQGEVKRALPLAQDAMVSRASVESPPEKASAQVVYALGLEMSGLNEPAIQSLESATEVLRGYGFNQRYASACLRLAGLWRTRRDQEQSKIWLSRWIKVAKEYNLYHFQWWDPGLFAWAVKEAVRHGVEVEYATGLAMRRLQDHELSAFSNEKNGFGAVKMNGSQGFPLASQVPITSDLERELKQILAPCRDHQVENRVREMAAMGRVSPNLLKKLRNCFHLTWKEVLIFLSYYLRPGLDPTEGDIGLRSRVAAELCISENTLKCHVASIRRKLKLPHRIGTVGLLAWAAENGILLPVETASAEKIVPRGDIRPVPQ